MPRDDVRLDFCSARIIVGWPVAEDRIDMTLSKAEIDTWESGCKVYTATVNAWKAMLDESFRIQQPVDEEQLATAEDTGNGVGAGFVHVRGQID